MFGQQIHNNVRATLNHTDIIDIQVIDEGEPENLQYQDDYVADPNANYERAQSYNKNQYSNKSERQSQQNQNPGQRKSKDPVFDDVKDLFTGADGDFEDFLEDEFDIDEADGFFTDPNDMDIVINDPKILNMVQRTLTQDEDAQKKFRFTSPKQETVFEEATRLGQHFKSRRARNLYELNDQECPDSELYIRSITGNENTLPDDCPSTDPLCMISPTAQIRILDMEVRYPDRMLFIFGDYRDQQYRHYPTDDLDLRQNTNCYADPVDGCSLNQYQYTDGVDTVYTNPIQGASHEWKWQDPWHQYDQHLADCWIARANHYGVIDRLIMWKTRDDMVMPIDQDESAAFDHETGFVDPLGILPTRLATDVPERHVGKINDLIKGTHCRAMSVQKQPDANLIVAVGTRHPEGSHTHVFIMTTDDQITDGSMRIWSDSPNPSLADGYPRYAGDVEQSVDGTIYITGWQTGWNEDDRTQDNCFLLRVVTLSGLYAGITLDYARTWASSFDERCTSLQVTRAADLIYVTGDRYQAAVGYAMAFYGFQADMHRIKRWSYYIAPNAPDDLFVKRLILNNREVYVANDVEDLDPGTLFYFCGWTTKSDDETFFFGQLDYRLKLTYLRSYTSPGKERGGDCDITRDNEYFVGGFSTQHRYEPATNIQITGTQVRGNDQSCATNLESSINNYVTTYQSDYYSWVSCDHYTFNWSLDARCCDAIVGGGCNDNFNGGDGHTFRTYMWDGETSVGNPGRTDDIWRDYSFCYQLTGSTDPRMWMEFEQDCQNQASADDHWDWFIFKMPVSAFTNANEDTTPEDAAYLGWWRQSGTISVGGQDYHTEGLEWCAGRQQTWCVIPGLPEDADLPYSADERLHTLTVDEFGFIYVGGHTTHTDQTYSTYNRVRGLQYYEAGLFGKTHWGLTFEFPSSSCDHSCNDITANAAGCGTCSMGLRWVRPMKFQNGHNPIDNASNPVQFMSDIKGSWSQRYWETNTGNPYYQDLVWPINEHIDGVGDDPCAEGPIPGYNNDYNHYETDDAPDIYTKGAEIDGTYTDALNRCYDMTDQPQEQSRLMRSCTRTTVSYGWDYIGPDQCDYKDYNNQFGANDYDDVEDAYDLTGVNAITPVQTTVPERPLVNNMKNFLFSIAQQSFTPGEYWINKNEDYVIQLPTYCSWGPYNDKGYVQQGMVTDFRAVDFSTTAKAYSDSPPTAYGYMTLDEDIYYINYYGGYDMADELQDGRTNDYKCDYPYYNLWHDKYTGPSTNAATNAMQTRNRRQQFSRVKIYVNDFSIDPPNLIADLPSFEPTVGQTLTYQYDLATFFSPGTCDYVELTLGKGDTRQMPAWVHFNEANSTIWMQPNAQSIVDVEYSFEFKCCNKLEQCAIGTFTITTRNLKITKKHVTQKFHIQYDSTSDKTEHFNWVLNQYQYEELNTPDKDSGLSKDHYSTSDHYAVWTLNNAATYDGTPDFFAGVDYAGVYYGQPDGSAVRGTTRTYSYNYGDWWNVCDPTCDTDTLEVYINTRPTKTGTFPTFTDLDPYFNVTDYFDGPNGSRAEGSTIFNQTFGRRNLIAEDENGIYLPWVKDDYVDHGDVFDFDLDPYCAEQDTNDQIQWSVTYSDNTQLPDWLQHNPVTNQVYGIPRFSDASEFMNLKFLCYDEWGATQLYTRTLLVNICPRTRQSRVVITTLKDRKFGYSLEPYIYDEDGDEYELTMKYGGQEQDMNNNNIFLSSPARSIGGRAREVGKFGWYQVVATDPHGCSTILDIKIVVSEFRPQVRFSRQPPDRTITEGLHYSFPFPDGLIYERNDAALSCFMTDFDKNPLPYWIEYDHNTMLFRGLAPSPRVLHVRWSCLNPTTGLTATVTFRVFVIPNNNPHIDLDIYPRDQYVWYNDTADYNYGSWFEYTITQDHSFDLNNTNWYPDITCIGSNSAPLPSWLKYNPVNRTIYGFANQEGVFSVDWHFFDDQRWSIYANQRIIVRPIPIDWIPIIIMYIVSISWFLAMIIFFIYVWDYSIRVLNRARIKRLKFKQQIIKNIDKRFGKYREINLRFYLPDQVDVLELKKHELPVEKEDFNFNQSYIDDDSDYSDDRGMLTKFDKDDASLNSDMISESEY